MSKTLINFKPGVSSEINEGCRLDTVQLGDYSYIMYNTVIENCKIGRFTSIGSNCSIGAGSHPTKMPSTSPFVHPDDMKMDEVIIGSDVWIGSNVVISEGVTIGNGAIIGANSFVNRNVESYEVVGGSPIKTLYWRASEGSIQMLNKFAWWNKPIEWITANISKLKDIGELINLCCTIK